MPKTSKIIQSLNAGELSPLMDFRTDQQKHQMGCRTMENFYPLIYGGAERRPGTYYVARAKQSADPTDDSVITPVWAVDTTYVINDYARDSVNGLTYICSVANTSSSAPTIFSAERTANPTYWTAAGKVRKVDFVYSVDQAYTLELGNQYIRFYANRGRFVGVLAASTTAWATATQYYAGGFVVMTNVIYRCIISHTSTNAGSDGTGGTPDAAANPTQWSVAALTSDSYPIYEIPTPYLTADLFQLKFEHSADVMYITHPNYEERKLSRINTTTFVLEELNYQDGPFQRLNSVISALLTPSATTGSITLTPSGTNANGTTFDPFQTGTTAGHAPSGTTGATAVGTSQTLKSITGALFKVVHAMKAVSIDKTFSAAGSSDSLLVYKGVKWDYVTQGTHTSTSKLERSYDDLTWETLAGTLLVSEDNNNVVADGVEDIDDAYYRITVSEITSGSITTQFTVRDTSHIGIIEIVSVDGSTPAVATGTVVRTLGSTDVTHRWAEGYWSNYRGWPNAVAISSEERLTFVGSDSFPLTTWGSVSGQYDNMTEGDLANDAIIYTLVGSGRQNAIRWIVSKNALVLGTYGGEHILGASDDKEAMTPRNVKAKIQSTYGSEDIQAIMVGDAILFVQRGGRRLREMHYDFEKDQMIAEDLTVFANHITESTITDLAYQRTPDPMVWCARGDGVLAVLSYERAQDVWSWCRLITGTTSYTVESDFESVCIIPSGSEEDIIYVSVKRIIDSSTVRYIEYFSTRDF